MSALGVKFISAAKAGNANNRAVNAKIDVSFFIFIPLEGVRQLIFGPTYVSTEHILKKYVCTVYIKSI